LFEGCLEEGDFGLQVSHRVALGCRRAIAQAQAGQDCRRKRGQSKCLVAIAVGRSGPGGEVAAHENDLQMGKKAMDLQFMCPSC